MKTMTYILNVAVFAVFTQFAFAETPDWEDCPSCYENSATISGAVILNEGTQLGDTGDIFAAFDDAGNNRGIALHLSPPFGPYANTTVFEMQIRADVNGDHIIFKYYDASADAVLDIAEDYTFLIDDVIGDGTFDANGDPHAYDMNDPWELTIGVPDLSCPACDDNDAGIGFPNTCASASAQYGCNLTWGPPGSPTIGELCPVSCGLCPVVDVCGVCDGDGSSCAGVDGCTDS